jgi:hypothetical protein
LGLFSIDKSIVGNILKVTALGHKKAICSSENRILLEEDIFRLDEIVIQQQLSALNVISKIDLKLRKFFSGNLEESTWTIYRTTRRRQSKYF